MNITFTNRNIVILGGSKGIAFEAAKQLASDGANICLVGRDLPRLEASYAKLAENILDNNKHIYVNCDLMHSNAVEFIWEKIVVHWNGEVDSLVLNAGGPPLKKSVTDVTIDEWQQYFQSLFLSQITLVNRCIPFMKENKFGRIVSITSSGIIELLQGLVISNSIRSALSAWLKNLSSEVASFGININSVVIGKVATSRLQKLDSIRAQEMACNIEDIKKKNCEAIPVGRYGTTVEAANAILFLLSAQSSYVTGSHIYIDGGSIKKCF